MRAMGCGCAGSPDFLHICFAAGVLRLIGEQFSGVTFGSEGDVCGFLVYSFVWGRAAASAVLLKGDIPWLA